jgi:hypothetical protein
MDMRSLILAKIEQVKNDLTKNSKSIWLKKELKKCYNELDKFNRNEEKEKYGINIAKSIFKKHGVQTAQYSTTSIRGFHTFRRGGYEIQNHDVRFIVFRGIRLEVINEIASDLKTIGFVLETVNESCILIKSYSKIS